uniref:Uncharacterized protein n=1 Tax=Stegastes partitus TaxID=144197 RepID=A0A3B5AQ41_9TELE
MWVNHYSPPFYCSTAKPNSCKKHHRRTAAHRFLLLFPEIVLHAHQCHILYYLKCLPLSTLCIC